MLRGLIPPAHTTPANCYKHCFCRDTIDDHMQCCNCGHRERIRQRKGAARTCRECGGRYLAKRVDQVFCATRCSNRFHQRERRDRERSLHAGIDEGSRP